jgi:hypothetical protein
MKRIKFSLLLFFFISFPLLSAEYYLESFDYFLNIPEHWEVYSAETEDYLIFREAGGAADFHVLSTLDFIPGTDPAAVAAHMLAGLEPELETADFFYNGMPAVFGTIGFGDGRSNALGYVVCIDLPGRFVVLLAYAGESVFNTQMPGILSCIDGFSYAGEGLRLPGPVSQFYYGFPGVEPAPVRIRLGGDSIAIQIDPGEWEASQVMIEREARILADPKNFDMEAWKRYYRMIFRDSYGRLIPAASEITELYRYKSDYEIASDLLNRLQSFEYLRTGTLSDLQAPLKSLVSGSGDCDSLGLLYCILLDRLGIKALLMVSTEYGHSMAAVDVEGPGARFPVEGTNYLAAELTDDVDIGLIDAQMADPSKWTAVDFDKVK